MPVKPSVIHSDPDILGGTPVFVDTRVPMKTLLGYLKAGESLAVFLWEPALDGLERAAGLCPRSRAGTEGGTSPLGTETGVRAPARARRARGMASRRVVVTRCPGL